MSRLILNTVTVSLPPPGWYADPSGAPGQRYFDGREWTGHRVGAAGPPRAPITPPRLMEWRIPAGASHFHEFQQTAVAPRVFDCTTIRHTDEM